MKLCTKLLAIFGLIAATGSLIADPVLSDKQIAEIFKHSEGKKELSRKVHILLCWSKKDHREGRHDYQGFAKNYAGRLNKLEKVTTSLINGFPNEEQLKSADLVILNHRNADFSEQQQKNLDAYLKAGKGMIVVHQGLAPTKGAKEWANRIGYAFSPDKEKHSKFGIGMLKMQIDNSHDIFKGFPKEMTFREELYWELIDGKTPGLKMIGKSSLPGKEDVKWPLFWTVESGGKAEGGRIFCAVIGHYNDFTEGSFLKIVMHRAAAWCLREPFGAFKELCVEK